MTTKAPETDLPDRLRVYLQGVAATGGPVTYAEAARALGLEDKVGRLAKGGEADIVVLDAKATAAMAHRYARVETLEEELFLLMTLGDDRAVRATYIAGDPVHSRQDG